MIEKVRSHCKELLASKKLGLIYGLANRQGRTTPCFFGAPEELDGLVLAGKQALVFTCRPSDKNIIALMQERFPGKKIGIVGRGCDERVLFELAKRFQLDLTGIELIGIACDRAQAEECRCTRPHPQHPVFGEKIENKAEDPRLKKFLAMSPEERLAFWKHQFSKCMKCYGCRNVCPMCFCKDCQMEGARLVPRGELPPGFPMFHFIHMMHLADRCIDCGECENACPMDIPLRLLKKIMRGSVQDLFGYEPGADATMVSPFTTKERGEMSHAEQ